MPFAGGVEGVPHNNDYFISSETGSETAEKGYRNPLV